MGLKSIANNSERRSRHLSTWSMSVLDVGSVSGGLVVKVRSIKSHPEYSSCTVLYHLLNVLEIKHHDLRMYNYDLSKY